MVQRFQIEDLVGQDAAGVVFHALDTETGSPVALRRFFPFGPNGGGLGDKDQETFNNDLQALATLSHPALRPIICGGCDPVDQMPFIATEWIDGTSLASSVSQGPMTPDAAVELIDQALEISEMISQSLGHEAVWVNTGLNAVIIGDEASGKRTTFWISPVKWMAAMDDSRKGLTPIVKLLEEVMHWEGKAVTDTSGGGLGSWFRWLRSSSQTATLHEARRRLATCLGTASAPTSSVPTRGMPTTKAVAVKASAANPANVRRIGSPSKPKSKMPMILSFVFLGVLAAGLGGWAVMRQNPALLGKLAPSEPEEELSTASILADLEKPKSAAEEPTPPPTPEASAPEPAAAEPATPEPAAPEPTAASEKTTASVFAPEDLDGLMGQIDRDVVLEGVPQSIAYSKSRKTLYLVYSADESKTARVGILMKDAPADLSEKQLQPLLGKKLRIQGKLKSESAGKAKRLIVLIGSRRAIQTVE